MSATMAKYVEVMTYKNTASHPKEAGSIWFRVGAFDALKRGAHFLSDFVSVWTFINPDECYIVKAEDAAKLMDRDDGQ
ncbi:MAG: hypothetical protein GY722_24255 [bacterium]|nr:hypothetical protein [bacterium]